MENQLMLDEMCGSRYISFLERLQHSRFFAWVCTASSFFATKVDRKVNYGSHFSDYAQAA